MKNVQIGILGFLTLVAFGCQNVIQCDSITKKRAVFLIDISDNKLFTEIKSDINTNLPRFMQSTRLSEIEECQQFTLSFAHLCGKDDLELSNETISIGRKGLSEDDEKILAKPTPLINLTRRKLSEFDTLSNDTSITSGSNIGNTLFKAINQDNPDEKTYYFLFSDLLEHTSYINMYEGVTNLSVDEAIEKLIDPVVLEEYKSKYKDGLRANVIVITKSFPQKKRITPREVKLLWEQVFDELNVDVQFVDNLSNRVKL